MSDLATLPTLHSINRHNGAAGQLVYVVTLEYPGEGRDVVTFVGSSYGGPVLLQHSRLGDVWVSDPDRYGRLSPRWVRRFFGLEA